jgi:hypothetical protein
LPVFLLDDFLQITAHVYLLFAAKDLFRLYSLVPGTAFGVEEAE